MRVPVQAHLPRRRRLPHRLGLGGRLLVPEALQRDLGAPLLELRGSLLQVGVALDELQHFEVLVLVRPEDAGRHLLLVGRLHVPQLDRLVDPAGPRADELRRAVRELPRLAQRRVHLGHVVGADDREDAVRPLDPVEAVQQAVEGQRDHHAAAPPVVVVVVLLGHIHGHHHALVLPGHVLPAVED